MKYSIELAKRVVRLVKVTGRRKRENVVVRRFDFVVFKKNKKIKIQGLGENNQNEIVGRE